MSETETATNSNYSLPSHKTLTHSSKIAIVEDKPVMFDYWTASFDGEVIIGAYENGEKVLVKSQDEFTSPISKIFKVENEYIIVTQNSLYIVNANIQAKNIK